jgi:tripartite-type tricarboxylate transporter receptor subunit TctC
MKRLLSGMTAIAAATGAVLGLIAGPAFAQDYPTKPVRIIVPYAPGGATDILARLLGEHFRKVFNQPFVVENKPGAFGIIGLEELAKAPADGHTLFIGNNTTNAITPILHAKKMKIDYHKSVMTIARVAELPAFFSVTTAGGFAPRTHADFLAYVKANPGKVLYGTTGIGSFPHFDTIEYMKATGTDMGHIPIKSGAAGALQAILTGDVQTSIINVATAGPQIKSGKIAPLAVINKTRLADFPDVPTMAEIGLPNIGTMQWIGLFATAGTPDAIVQKLHDATVGALDSDAVKTTFAKSVIFASASKSPADAKTWLDSEWTHWGKIISTSGVDPDKAE